MFSDQVALDKSLFSITFPNDRKLYFDEQGVSIQPLVEKTDTAHVKAYPALLNTEFNGDIQAQLPHPYYFNHALVYIPKQHNLDMELWLDPTIPSREWHTQPPQVQGEQALVLMGEKIRFVRIGN